MRYFYVWWTWSTTRVEELKRPERGDVTAGWPSSCYFGLFSLIRSGIRNVLRICLLAQDDGSMEFAPDPCIHAELILRTLAKLIINTTKVRTHQRCVEELPAAAAALPSHPPFSLPSLSQTQRSSIRFGFRFGFQSAPYVLYVPDLAPADGPGALRTSNSTRRLLVNYVALSIAPFGVDSKSVESALGCPLAFRPRGPCLSWRGIRNPVLGRHDADPFRK